MSGTPNTLVRRRGMLVAVAVAVSVTIGACASLPFGKGGDTWTLYAGLIKTQGYTVGSPLSSSGLHVLQRPTDKPNEALQRVLGTTPSDDFGWYHIGWNTPRISGIAVNPSNPATMFLAGGNGVLRTYDAGASWKIVTGWQVTEVQDVAVDPANPAEVYLGSGYGVWRTRDSGETWIESNEGIARKYTQAVAVDSDTPRRVFAATERGIFLSTNGAESWRRVGPEGLNVMDLQQSISNPMVWMAATDGDGLWKSVDDGNTWAKQENTHGSSYYVVAIDPFDERNIAATGWDTGVSLTMDGGATWVRIGDELPTPHGYEVIFDRNEAGRLWFATLEGGMYFTEDAGATWSSAGLPGTMVFDMLFVNMEGAVSK